MHHDVAAVLHLNVGTTDAVLILIMEDEVTYRGYVVLRSSVGHAGSPVMTCVRTPAATRACWHGPHIHVCPYR